MLVALGEAESERDLAQLRRSCAGRRPVQQAARNKQRGSRWAKPFHYRSSDGFDIFGENNLQNDLLTLKTAFKSDIWFHTQKIHGSHVILVADGAEPTDRACDGSSHVTIPGQFVPVDSRRYGRSKNRRGPTGMVIYHVYQTAYVTPDEAAVERPARVKWKAGCGLIRSYSDCTFI